MRKRIYSRSDVRLQRHTNRPLPRKGIHSTLSLKLTLCSWPHRWFDLDLVCAALAIMLSTQIFSLNLWVIDLGIDILNFAPSLQFSCAQLPQ